MWTTPLFIVMAIAIVTGNAITMVIFTTSRRLRMRKYVLIANLAVADFFVGLISVPMYISLLVKGTRHFSSTFERVYRIQDSLFGTASLFALAALAVERAYATYFPFKYVSLRRINYSFGIALGWLSASLLGLLLFYLDRVINVALVLVCISVSLVTVIIAYALIWIQMTCAKHSAHQAIYNSNKKLTISLAIISLITLVAWIPLIVIQVEHFICSDVISSCNPIILSYEFAAAAKWLQYGNSVVNVIVYSLRLREFKKEMLRRLRCSRILPLHQERFELQNVDNVDHPDNGNMNDN
ncbi:sphingosine 1-phosphate receptor 2-like [Exaiptasia diaphana]|uniref:G-protein coupled receptors family 1 profile domain-containing protein n=1 Tax=Exaiptasia diaphana TaxID=2652724 RepID=A0A913YXG9_EXADI|nr:sphingosine 1-phosphate receptor 2-like [Exaiptasia diaphana]